MTSTKIRMALGYNASKKWCLVASIIGALSESLNPEVCAGGAKAGTLGIPKYEVASCGRETSSIRQGKRASSPNLALLLYQYANWEFA